MSAQHTSCESPVNLSFEAIGSALSSNGYFIWPKLIESTKIDRFLSELEEFDRANDLRDTGPESRRDVPFKRLRHSFHWNSADAQELIFNI